MERSRTGVSFTATSSSKRSFEESPVTTSTSWLSKASLATYLRGWGDRLTRSMSEYLSSFTLRELFVFPLF
ncbi:unnamed protein product [Musa acuminata subsp. malaccensis]|uniref:(wild Malaysian banana) hypothetical protein n=1 Tax=Musa acuminata subsp. malaccensis TaxID=214687 RepID=A0A804ICI0_MUSAM|nr:unnamed protein product [Musa acuminata subsp. malaccensis]